MSETIKSKTSSVRIKPQAIVMDIEGTTTDRNFMHTTLSPFFKSQMTAFLTDAFEWREVKQVIKQLRLLQQSGQYARMPIVAVGSKTAVISSVTENIRWQIRHKTMSSELKQMQLLCWLWGFDKDMIRTHIYDDVSTAMDRWKAQGVKLAIYSSGMVIAQKLFFTKTTRGNLFPLIDYFFDSSIGDKTDSQSYKIIVNTMKCEAKRVTFVTDDPNEAKAALNAGLEAVVIERPGKAVDSQGLTKVTSFNQI